MVLSHQCSLFPFLSPHDSLCWVLLGLLEPPWEEQDAAFANEISLCSSLSPGQCQAAADAPLCPPAVPQDLMDAPGAVLPPMWQPSTRKSSCSSCSQSGSSDGGPANGCSHERYEDTGAQQSQGRVRGMWQGQSDVAELSLVPAPGTFQPLHSLAAGIAALNASSIPGESLQARLDQWDQSQAEEMHGSVSSPHILFGFVGRAPLKLLCDNMKYQILSRAFYGCEYSSSPCSPGMCEG